jgi:hypothetical protein
MAKRPIFLDDMEIPDLHKELLRHDVTIEQARRQKRRIAALMEQKTAREQEIALGKRNLIQTDLPTGRWKSLWWKLYDFLFRRGM